MIKRERQPEPSKVGRLEFQDGKRHRNYFREAQFYHGRGAVHVHILLWLERLEHIPFDQIIRADIPPEEGPQRDLVLGSQIDWQSSGWPQREKPTEWDQTTEKLLLHHPGQAHTQHCRAYLEDVLEALKCHCDVLGSDGRTMLLQYCSKYLPKFSSSFSNEILSHEQASGFALSRRILEEYHPLAPEMVLQMANQNLPQCFVGGHIRRLSIPVPVVDDETISFEKPASVIRQYMSCPWRREDMTLKEYLRKASREGTIHQKFKRRHKFLGIKQPLEQWINEVSTRGEVMLSPILYSRVSDKFYGQWLLLNVPFRELHQLWHKCVLKVPKSYRCLTLCLHWRGQAFWRKIAQEVKPSLAIEAHSDAKIENLLAMLQAQTELVDSYLNNELNIQDHPEPVLKCQLHTQGGKALNLALEQVQISQIIHRSVQEALELREPEEADEATAWERYWEQKDASKPRRAYKAISVLGPAGSGKTTVIEVAINRAYERGANVKVGCPTGLLSTGYKDKFPHIDVDTLHGMFALHRSKHDTLDKMMNIDLLVIDEVGQISQETFERLMEMWDAAERRPAIVFVGDFAQLKGADPRQACDSARWRTDVRVCHLRTMRRCKCEKLRWKLELLRYWTPSNAELRNILRAKRAPKNRDPGDREEPSLDDIRQIFEETPDTVFATISRYATGVINRLALQVLFPDQEPEATVPADPEANPHNFQGKKQVGNEPSQLPIHRGLKLTLTRNLHWLCAI